MRAAPSAGHIWIADGSLYFSNNGGGNLAPVINITESSTVGFGAPKPAQGTYLYSVFIVGRVNNVMGCWRSDDYGATWHNMPSASGSNYPMDVIELPRSINGDPNIYMKCYTAGGGDGWKQYA